MDKNTENALMDKRISEILKKIEIIKSVIAGRNVSFAPYTHDHKNRLSEKKLKIFVNRLSYHTLNYYDKHNLNFTPNIGKFYHLFYTLVIKYTDTACNMDDWIFESIIKLSTTVEKVDYEEQSVFDILATDFLDEYPDEEEDFLPYYEEFNNLFKEPSGYDSKNFVHVVRDAVNCFLDEEKISFYVDEQKYKETISILDKVIDKLILMGYFFDE